MIQIKEKLARTELKSEMLEIHSYMMTDVQTNKMMNIRNMRRTKLIFVKSKSVRVRVQLAGSTSLKLSWIFLKKYCP